jgi:hypothetical protein
MDKIDAIIVLLTGPHWVPRPTREQTLQRIEAMRLIGTVTRAELVEAKKRVMQREADAMKAEAAAREAALPTVTDWDT